MTRFTVARSCMRCGGDASWLVTGATDSQAPGRLLVYCTRCRREAQDTLDLVIPLSVLDHGHESLLKALYETGTTATDPTLTAEHLRVPLGEWSTAAHDMLNKSYDVAGAGVVTGDERRTLVEVLEAFNRKERHLLWEQATGAGGGVRLSDGFRRSLSVAIGVPVPAAPEHLVALDYHLNWLYGALLLKSGRAQPDRPHAIPPAEEDDPHGRRAYERNQEDVDLLVAFQSEDLVHVILVEAKGFTPWGTKQMQSKLRRLERILRDAGPSDGIELHLVLTSFTPPRKLDVDWGQWGQDDTGQPPWVPLREPVARLLIEECDTSGARMRDGQYVHVVGLVPQT